MLTTNIFSIRTRLKEEMLGENIPGWILVESPIHTCEVSCACIRIVATASLFDIRSSQCTQNMTGTKEPGWRQAFWASSNRIAARSIGMATYKSKARSCVQSAPAHTKSMFTNNKSVFDFFQIDEFVFFYTISPISVSTSIEHKPKCTVTFEYVFYCAICLHGQNQSVAFRVFAARKLLIPI